MSIKLTTTRQAAALNGVKVCVYGAAGAGKTCLAATTGGRPIIISAEAGLLSLRGVEIPVIEVSTMADIHEAYAYLASPEGQQFDWICIDSISEIAEVVLAAEKKATKDPRAAYGALADQMHDLVRAFRDLPRNVYMSAKQDRQKDEMSGAMLYGPAMPGQRLAQQLPYMFDEMLCLRAEANPEGQIVRFLQTQPDFTRQAKDRSGALDQFEQPDLSVIAAKINPAT